MYLIIINYTAIHSIESKNCIALCNTCTQNYFLFPSMPSFKISLLKMLLLTKAISVLFEWSGLMLLPNQLFSTSLVECFKEKPLTWRTVKWLWFQPTLAPLIRLNPHRYLWIKGHPTCFVQILRPTDFYLSLNIFCHWIVKEQNTKKAEIVPYLTKNFSSTRERLKAQFLIIFVGVNLTFFLYIIWVWRGYLDTILITRIFILYTF